MNQPYLSIIIPTYNSEAFIVECIESIIHQTFTDFEIIVQDGASSDKTLELCAELIGKYNSVSIQVTSERDNGVYFAMNKGILKSKGKWLYFLGSDDKLFDPKVLAAVFEDPSHVNYDLLYGKVLLKKRGILYGEETSYCVMLKTQMNISHQAIFYRRELFERVGLYGLKNPVYADFEYNLKCFKDATVRKHFLNKVIAIFGEDGLSNIDHNIDDFYKGLLKTYVVECENPAELYLDNGHLKEQLRILTRSKEYRLGYFLLSPFKKIKQLLSGQ